MGIKTNKVTRSTFLPMFQKNSYSKEQTYHVALLIKMGKNNKLWEYFYLQCRMKVLHKVVPSCYLIID